MNLVPLLREPADGARVLALPPWIGPGPRSHALYWHRPRSAYVRHDGEGPLLIVSLWCGPSRFVSETPRRRPLFAGPDYVRLTDVEPPEFKCGTCVGRLEGHLRADGLIFAPRDAFALPAWCPGEGDPHLCFACGFKTRARRGWWTGGESPHRPLPALVERCEPCPRHGWENVVARDGRLVCRRFVGNGSWYCDYDCGPRA